MQVFAETPRVLQEGLIFPYLEGAEFVRWYERDTAFTGPPYGSAVPVSTEQVLHPERYARHDMPVEVPLDTAGAGPGETDVMGEMGVAVLSADLAGAEVVSTTVPHRVGRRPLSALRDAEGPALVWLVAWDDQRAADRFLCGLGRPARGARRGRVPHDRDRDGGGGHPGIRVVIAPAGWAGGPATASSAGAGPRPAGVPVRRRPGRVRTSPRSR